MIHQESSLAVVGPDGRFLGLIPPHRMLGVLLEEHREDMARLSGYLHQSAGARAASREGLSLRFWHRFHGFWSVLLALWLRPGSWRASSAVWRHI